MPGGTARQDALAQLLRARLRRQDAETGPHLLRQRQEGISVGAFQKCRIHHHRPAGLQQHGGLLAQMRIGALVGIGGVNATPNPGAAGRTVCQPEQALALHVRAQAQGGCMRVRLQQCVRGHGFAATRQAVGDHQADRRWRQQALGQRQVGLHVTVDVAGLHRAQRRHLGPHHGAVDGVETQHARSLVVATAAQNLVEQPVGQTRLLMFQQVDIDKSHFAGHVHPAQVFVELDAVKQLHPPVDQHHVGQVQVAMALPHPTGVLARLHQRRQLLELGLRPIAQGKQAVLQARVRQESLQLGKVIQGGLQDVRPRAKVRARRCDGCPLVHGHHSICQRRQVLGPQLAARANMVQPP